MAFDTNLVGKELLGPEYSSIGAQFGKPDLPGGYEFESGGRYYRAEDTHRGTRVIRDAGSVAERQAQQAREAQERATKLALETLESGKGKIGEIYSSRQNILLGEMDPTKQRYEQLLQEVTRRENEEVTRSTGATNRELGRRGIVSDSGVFDQELNRVLSPINQYYAGQAKEVGLEGENALRAIQNAITELSNKQATDELGLLDKISQLQFAGGSSLANLLNQASQASQQAAQANAQLQLQEILGLRDRDIADRQTKIAEGRYGMEEQLFPYNLQQLQAEIARINRSNTGSGGGINTLNLSSDFDAWSSGK